MLQGTFDIFTLSELIAMLASGSKTGTLAVTAGPATGRIHLRDGLCSGVEPDAGPTRAGGAELDGEARLAARLADVCFELARHPDGEFAFLTDEPPAGDHLVAVDDALVEVARLLEEWREVELLVPSLDLCPQLAPELGGESITLAAHEWSLAVSLDGRASIRELVEARRQPLIEVCQAVADLVERGAVRLNETRGVAGPLATGGLLAMGGPGDPLDYETPAVMPVEPYGPGVDEALHHPALPDADAATMLDGTPADDAASADASAEEVASADASGDEPSGDDVGRHDETPADDVPFDDGDAKDRGALLRMFSALRDA